MRRNYAVKSGPSVLVLTVLAVLMLPFLVASSAWLLVEKQRGRELVEFRERRLAQVAREEERIRQELEEAASQICESLSDYGFDDVFHLGRAYRNASREVQALADRQCEAATRIAQNTDLLQSLKDAVTLDGCLVEGDVARVGVKLRNPVEYPIDLEVRAAILNEDLLIDEHALSERAVQPGEERSGMLVFPILQQEATHCSMTRLSAIPSR